MGLFKSKTKTRSRADPVAYWFVHDNDDILPEGYVSVANSEDVIKCAHKIADTVSNMTIMLMQNGPNGDVRIKNKLSRKLDIEPCENMTRKNFLYVIAHQMATKGNCIVLPETDSEYIKNFKVLKNCSLCPDGESYKVIGDGRVYYPDEVLNFCLNPSANYPYKGEGFAPMIKSAVVNLAQENATKKSFLRSKWKPSLIISSESDSDELMDKEKRKKILESYTSTTEVGEPWLIPAGEIDVKTIQPLTLNDLAVNESINIDTKTVAAAMGVPPFLVGAGQFSKDEYNNFIETTIYSFAMIIQQELTKKTLFSPDLYWRLNEQSLMQYSLSEKVSFVKEMSCAGIVNKNEGRVKLGYSPVDVEGMNDFTVLENYLKVSDLDKQKKLNRGGENGSE